MAQGISSPKYPVQYVEIMLMTELVSLALANVVLFVMVMLGLIDESTLEGFFMKHSSSSEYLARPFGGDGAGRSP